MHIGLYATNEYVTPLPSGKVHGVISLVNGLAHGLIQRGHTVDYFCPEGSTTTAHRRSLHYPAFVNLPVSRRVTDRILRRLYTIAYSQRMVNDIVNYAQTHKLDIVHCHNLQDVLQILPFITKVPTLLTVHENFFANKNPDSAFNHFLLKLYQDIPQLSVVTISKRQQCGAPNFPFFATVYDGVDVNKFRFNSNPHNYLFFSGRLIPEKGPDIAIKAAERAGCSIKVAGVFDPRAPMSTSFERSLRTLLKQPWVQFSNKVSQVKLAKLYANAQAVLVPIQWEEPFGLVMVEAMACGTPVIAFKRGAVSELVRDGVTGFVVRTLPEMVRAIKKIPTLRRQDCRDHVEKYFSTTAMARNYETIYQAVSRKHKKR